MTNGFSYLNRFVTTLTSTINFLTRGSEDLTLSYIRNKTMTKLKMTMNFDNRNNVTSSKLKKVNDKNVKPVCHLILKISFLTLLGCAVKIALDINQIHIWLDG